MAWKRVNVDEQRMQFVIRAVSGKESLTSLCREFGISRPTGYLWRGRYERAGSFAALREQSRRPRHCPTRTVAEKEERVVALRQETGWGAKKLHGVLRDEQDVRVPVRTIHRILERRGLVSEEAHAPAPQRFERSAPNELWQMDSKGQYPRPERACHPLTLLDDHSRYVVGLYALPALTIAAAWPCLIETFRNYGVPQGMLMDRGALWWSVHNGWSLTWLSVQLIEQGIGLHYGRVRHPQTQGKVERFHRTLGAEVRHRGLPATWDHWPGLLAAIQQDYNQRRPHEALGGRRPQECYQPSGRSYQEQPRAWEYPPGSEVQRLNSQGMLEDQGKRWFVCQALGGQRVRVERVEGKLLVSYRHMYIREIDLAGECTRPLVVKRQDRRERAGLGDPPVALRAPSGSPSPQDSPEV
jgi:transposase InsO family protein